MWFWWGTPPRLLVRLPKLPDGGGIPSKPTDPAPEVPSQSTKHPLDVANEVMEILDHDEAAGPPKKKKKKKNKSRDRSKDEIPSLEAHDDGVHPSTSMAKPKVVVEEPVPVPTVSGTLAEETRTPKKKKKKKDADLERFRLEQWEAKAKEMTKVKYREIQHNQDFKALRNYQKSLPANLLGTINGANHSGFLLGRHQKEGNYMNKKSSKKRNLMSVERLLSRIAKYANEPEKRLKEAHQMTRATFPMVQGMPSGDKCTPELAVHVLMDCEGNLIDCDC